MVSGFCHFTKYGLNHSIFLFKVTIGRFSFLAADTLIRRKQYKPIPKAQHRFCTMVQNGAPCAYYRHQGSPNCTLQSGSSWSCQSVSDIDAGSFLINFETDKKQNIFYRSSLRLEVVCSIKIQSKIIISCSSATNALQQFKMDFSADKPTILSSERR